MLHTRDIQKGTGQMDNNTAVEMVNASKLVAGDIVRLGNQFDAEYQFVTVEIAEKFDTRNVKLGYFNNGITVLTGNNKKFARVI